MIQKTTPMRPNVRIVLFYFRKNKHYYNVRYRHIRKCIKIICSDSLLEIFYKFERQPPHLREKWRCAYTSVKANIPLHHKFSSECNSEKYIVWQIILQYTAKCISLKYWIKNNLWNNSINLSEHITSCKKKQETCAQIKSRRNSLSRSKEPRGHYYKLNETIKSKFMDTPMNKLNS